MTLLYSLVRSVLIALPLLTFVAPAHGDGLPWIDASRESSSAALPALDDRQYVFRFTGAGGFYLGGRDDAILVDPFFSNSSPLRVMSLQPLPVDAALIARHLPPVEKVRGVLIGHAHYDHALDVPVVASLLPADARVFGSETTVSVLAPAIPAQRLVRVDPVFLEQTQPGTPWVNITPRLRILPVKSAHSPHVGRWVLASGKMHAALKALPDNALGWKAGTVLSYVVDFLDENGAVAFRAFVQTSASQPPYGVPASELLDSKPVDLAVLCAANFDNVEDYPAAVLKVTRPRHVALVHWERFWEPYVPGAATILPGLDLQALYQSVSAAAPTAKVYLPQRGAQFVVDAFPVGKGEL